MKRPRIAIELRPTASVMTIDRVFIDGEEVLVTEAGFVAPAGEPARVRIELFASEIEVRTVMAEAEGRS